MGWVAHSQATDRAGLAGLLSAGRGPNDFYGKMRRFHKETKNPTIEYVRLDLDGGLRVSTNGT